MEVIVGSHLSQDEQLEAVECELLTKFRDTIVGEVRKDVRDLISDVERMMQTEPNYHQLRKYVRDPLVEILQKSEFH